MTRKVKNSKGEQFPSIAEAAKKYNVSRYSIHSAIARSHYCGGALWAYEGQDFVSSKDQAKQKRRQVINSDGAVFDSPECAAKQCGVSTAEILDSITSDTKAAGAFWFWEWEVNQDEGAA